MSSRLRVAQANVPLDRIDLGVGQPGFDLLPHQLMRTAAQTLFSASEAPFLNYGFEQGEQPLRHLLADFLTAEYGRAAAAERLFITNGSSLGLDLICTLFTEPGDTVLVGEPTYFLALRVLADHGLKIVPIPIDEHGLPPEQVAAAVRKHRPRLLYTIPTFQNPTGITQPAVRRRALVELAREHQFLLVADEVYQLLHYTAAPPPPIAAYIQNDDDPIVSLGSFSKILAPGLRLGWIQSSDDIIAALAGGGLVDSGGGLAPMTGAMVRRLMETGGHLTHLNRLRRVYGRRLQTLHDALQQHLPPEWVPAVPPGGFFLWLDGLPHDTADLLSAAHEAGVGYVPGRRFSAADRLHDCLRLSFAFYDEDDLRTAAARLGRLLTTAVG